jgi:hypothetical protein
MLTPTINLYGGQAVFCLHVSSLKTPTDYDEILFSQSYMENLGLASTKAQTCSVTPYHAHTDLQSLCHSTQHGLITLGTAARTIP